MTYLALTGGIGGAKLALGLAHVLGPEEIVFAANTGDDFEHLGLHISPDIDTLTYTLANVCNPETGWGRDNESWHFMATLEQLGGETWFRLGDKDLALHLERTRRLNAGATLTGVTGEISAALGIAHAILPMSDDPVRTVVQTAGGALAFQHYFVRDRCQPKVTGFHFAGADSAAVNPALLAVLEDCKGVLICPSNPFVSIDPILAVPGMRDALKASGAPIVAVSPIVADNAIKGPTAKIMHELNVPSTAGEVARHYGDLLDGFLIDERDAALHGTLHVPTFVAQSIMVTLADRIELARAALTFITDLGVMQNPMTNNRKRKSDRPDIWAIVPIKSFDAPKKRLAGVLNAEERRALMLAMTRDVLTALSQSSRLAGVLVVSRSPEALALAGTFNARTFTESPGSNLPGALEEAAAHATSALGARGIFVVPADVPLINAIEIDRVLANHRRVTLLPDSDCVGTNGLVCSPPDVIDLVFDGKSFEPHRRNALDAGHTPHVVHDSGFALDIDHPADLQRLLRDGPDSLTGTFLRESDIAARLAASG